MSAIAKSLRVMFVGVGVAAAFALPGALSGLTGCECDECRSTPGGCYKFDQCYGSVCNYNGPACTEGCVL